MHLINFLYACIISNICYSLTENMVEYMSVMNDQV